ncbi:glycerol-3-phosphate cytidylyltransferase [Halomonas sp. 1513]|nr:glycerol-3-phosphate cytidylyltransferase [Halomonas sp. 1513]
MKKTIITYGTFDMFHVGHLNLLKKIHSIAENVIVGVSTDEFNLEKGKRVMIPFENRVSIVQSIKYVDRVIPECSWDQKHEDIRKFNVDVFAIGDDWKGKFDHLADLCEVIYLPRTENVSTTEIKKSLRNFLSISQEDLRQAFEVLEILKNDLE